jgi:hypothetical protein
MFNCCVGGFSRDFCEGLARHHCKPKTPLHFPYTRERTEYKVGIQEISRV